MNVLQRGFMIYSESVWLRPFALLALITLITAPAFFPPDAHAATWTNTAGGTFNAVGNWDPNDVPDSNTEDALLAPLSTGYIVTLDDAMFPTGLTNQRVRLNAANVAGNAVSLSVNSTGSPFEWILGNPTLPSSPSGLNQVFLGLGRGTTMSLSNVNITVLSSDLNAVNSGSYILLQSAVSASQTLLTATNSRIILRTAPSGGAGNNGLFVGQKTELAMTDGELIAVRTNSVGFHTSSAAVSSDQSKLTLTRTRFEFDSFQIGFNASVSINNGAIPTSTNLVWRDLSINSGSATLAGTVRINEANAGFNLTLGMPITVGGSSILNFTGGVLSVVNNRDITLNPAGTHPGGGRKVQMNIVGNSEVNARHLRIGGNAAPSPSVDDYQVTLSGSNPSLKLTGDLEVGSDKTGAGRFVMSSGTLIASNIFVGSATADGYYEQTAGSAIVSNKLVLRKGASLGAERFKVSSGASMTFKGFGMELAGSGSFLVDAADWDTLGSFIFDPLPGIVTQQLTVAGLNLGGSTAGYTNNFAIGTLDLSSYSAANRLQLVAPDTTVSTSLYVSVISPIATNALISSYDVYYLPELNPILFTGGDQGRYSLTGGGFLVPIPESSPWLLGGLASLLLAVRRRFR